MQSDLNHIEWPLLPSRKKIKLRNEVDRFGFTEVLRKRLKLKQTYRPFCTWVHGWKWWQIDNSLQLGYDISLKNKRIVVSSKYQYDVLKQEGYENIYIGGLPYLYADYNQVYNRKHGSVLVMLPKAQHYAELKSGTVDYLKYIADYNCSYDITICVFEDDYRRDEMKQALKRFGLKYIVGASPDDAYSLFRMQALFGQFEYCVSNTIGSYFVYAAYSGAKISIFGDYYQSFTNTVANMNKYGEYEYVKLNYAWLFKDNIYDSVSAKEWAAKEIGADYVMSNSELIHVLGWSPVGQCRGYYNGLKAIYNRKVYSE